MNAVWGGNGFELSAILIFTEVSHSIRSSFIGVSLNNDEIIMLVMSMMFSGSGCHLDCLTKLGKVG